MKPTIEDAAAIFMGTADPNRGRRRGRTARPGANSLSAPRPRPQSSITVVMTLFMIGSGGEGGRHPIPTFSLGKSKDLNCIDGSCWITPACSTADGRSGQAANNRQPLESGCWQAGRRRSASEQRKREREAIDGTNHDAAAAAVATTG